MDPALFTVFRFTLSAIPFIPFMLQGRGDGKTRAAGVELGLWAFGLLTSDAGRASFISAFTVVTVPLIDGIFGATVPSPTWFGAIVTLMGVGMLESSGSPPCVGDILNFFSAVFFGVHMLRIEHFSRVTSKESQIDVNILVVDRSTGFSHIVSLDTCILYWRFLNWAMLMG